VAREDRLMSWIPKDIAPDLGLPCATAAAEE
jgi:hypothetical protein